MANPRRASAPAVSRSSASKKRPASSCSSSKPPNTSSSKTGTQTRSSRKRKQDHAASTAIADGSAIPTIDASYSMRELQGLLRRLLPAAADLLSLPPPLPFGSRSNSDQKMRFFDYYDPYSAIDTPSIVNMSYLTALPFLNHYSSALCTRLYAQTLALGSERQIHKPERAVQHLAAQLASLNKLQSAIYTYLTTGTRKVDAERRAAHALDTVKQLATGASLDSVLPAALGPGCPLAQQTCELAGISATDRAGVAQGRPKHTVFHRFAAAVQDEDEDAELPAKKKRKTMTPPCSDDEDDEMLIQMAGRVEDQEFEGAGARKSGRKRASGRHLPRNAAIKRAQREIEARIQQAGGQAWAEDEQDRLFAESRRKYSAV